jgi:hypothetical protein
MNLIEITDEQLDATGTVALRKLAKELGFKGMSSSRGGDIRSAVRHARNAQIELDKVAALNEAKRPARIGRSRAGMTIIARGTEIHKSATFKEAAEAAGWKMIGPHHIEDNNTYVATAVKGQDKIELVWNGRAYDYAASSARLAGKARKIRNLKEALRSL